MKKLSFPNLSQNRTLMLTMLGSLLAGGVIGGILVAAVSGIYQGPRPSALRESGISTAHSEYQFIDPLIGIRGMNNEAKYAAMKQQVADYISSESKNGLASASVDFRDINEPGGFTLNPSEEYTPASLNKVPVMMAYYKLAETDPGVLSAKVWYSGAKDSNGVEEIRSAMKLVPGESYTVEELIEHMIRYSDNNAADLLLQHLQDIHAGATYLSVYSDLGTDPEVLTSYTDNVPVQKYSIFLRALYNATYLSRSGSERALELLSKTDFTEGIESGVPNDILVAQKFGEVRMTDSNGTLLGKEIHDCGIVYYPEHPYLLCIMTKAKGDDIPLLESEIASISRITYKNMQSLYP